MCHIVSTTVFTKAMVYKKRKVCATITHTFSFIFFLKLLHVVNNLHELLAEFIGLLHGLSLAVDADDWLGV